MVTKAKVVVFALALVTDTSAAQAQPYVELGASIGQACLMGEASCADEVATRGWQAGLWINEKTAVRFRHLDAPRPDRVNHFQGYDVRWSNQGRSLWLGEVTWHFGAPSPARIFVGATAGVRIDRWTITCASGPCAEAGRSIGDFSSGPRLTRGAVAGVSVHPMRRVTITGQLGCYDFPGEHVGTFVFSFQAAYRHPLGR